MSTPQQPSGQRPLYDPQPGQGYIKLRPAHDFLKSTDEDLLAKADECLSRAGSALDQPQTEVDPSTHSSKYDDFSQLRLFLEAQSCLVEVLRRRADRAAAQDRKREHRRFLTELLVIGGLIVVEILLGLLALREGRQQAAILDRMNKNTADTAAQIQRAADATTASLEILRQERAERAKKPRLALFIGNTPLDRASIRLQAPAGLAQDAASFDLLVRNIGDAPVSTFRLHVLTPKGVGLDAEQLIIVPQIGPPTHPNTQVVTLQLPLLPAAETYRLQITVYAPKGHPAFKITFTVDAMELRAVAPLGSLTVLPLKP